MPRRNASLKLKLLLITVMGLSVLLMACGGGGGGDSAGTSGGDSADTSGGDSADTSTPALGQSTLMLDGGTGAAGTGGKGGRLSVGTYGSLKILKSGTVDASFTVAPITPEFGLTPFTVASNTTVDSVDNTAGALCQVSGGDGSLYIGDGINGCGDPGDQKVTGLTVAEEATLVLTDVPLGGDPTLRLENDLVIYGTVTGRNGGMPARPDVYIEANLISVESTGRITASTYADEVDAGSIQLGSPAHQTKTIINRGTIEAAGDFDQSGGLIYLEPDELVVNYGTIDASGGNLGGDAGTFLAYVHYGDFYSSGTVRLNGRGAGADGGLSTVETVSVDNTMGSNGDIIISGIWEANGADDATSGGSGGTVTFQTDAMGTVTVNAAMSVSGGNGTGWGASGDRGGFMKFLSEDLNSSDPILAAGKMSIAGTYDLLGGDGTGNGGDAGGLTVWCNKDAFSTLGTDVELVGFPVITVNGGDGINGGNGYGTLADPVAIRLSTYSTATFAAKALRIEASIQAKGGDADIAQAGSVGGTGSSVTIIAGNFGATDTALSTSGDIEVSGGAGDIGGFAGNISMEAGHVANSGDLTADGGDGTTDAGGDGGDISLTSNGAATSNSGTLSASGGAGSPPGLDGTISF